MGAALFLLGCGDYEIPLQNGYSFSRTDSENHAIIDKKRRVVVYPDITDYEQASHLILGCRRKSKFLLADIPELTTGFGYFILSTQTGEYVGGLSRDAFVRKRSSLGLSRQATLPHCS
jgi:hypothetical protein